MSPFCVAHHIDLVFFFKSLIRYEGEWAKGQPHGKGTLTLATGLVFTGHWQNGKKNGVGKLSILNGQEFISGTWRDTVLEGFSAMNLIYQPIRIFL